MSRGWPGQLVVLVAKQQDAGGSRSAPSCGCATGTSELSRSPLLPHSCLYLTHEYPENLLLRSLGRTGFEPAISRSTIGSGHPIEVSEHGSGHFVNLDLGGSGKVHRNGIGSDDEPEIELARIRALPGARDERRAIRVDDGI